MARPVSDAKRSALIQAAIRVIATRGLAAPTATIAREAGVSNGSLFNYFDTKADLFNQVYLELKTTMASATLDGLPSRAPLRKQMSQVWANWMAWAVSHPRHRYVLAQLSVSDDISPATRAAGHQSMAKVAGLLGRMRSTGRMREAPVAFVAAIMNSLAETTMDAMIRDAANAAIYREAGFDAFWRATN